MILSIRLAFKYASLEMGDSSTKAVTNCQVNKNQTDNGCPDQVAGSKNTSQQAGGSEFYAQCSHTGYKNCQV